MEDNNFECNYIHPNELVYIVEYLHTTRFPANNKIAIMFLDKLRVLCREATNAGNFNRLFKEATILEASKGRILAEMQVTKEHTNFINSLHGGMSSSLVDHFSTVALKSYYLADDIEPPTSVSVELSLSFLAAAGIGDTVIVEAETIRVGRKIAFLKANISNKANNKILVIGKHTKFLM